MFPVWFFLVMMSVIFYLLYLTRTTEDSIGGIGRNRFKKLQFWLKETSERKMPFPD